MFHGVVGWWAAGLGDAGRAESFWSSVYSEAGEEFCGWWRILNSHEAWEVCTEDGDSQELLEVFELAQCRRHWRDGINLLMWRRCLYFVHGEKLHQFLTDSGLGVCLCMYAWMPNLWRLFDLEGCGIRGTARTELYATTWAAYQWLPFAAQFSKNSDFKALAAECSFYLHGLMALAHRFHRLRLLSTFKHAQCCWAWIPI